MIINWEVVSSEHVREACRRLDTGAVKCLHPARNTFLVLGTKRYPAKFIRGLAYEIATGLKLDSNVDFSGGAETAEFLRSLGFLVDYPVKRRHSRPGSTPPRRSNRITDSRALDEKQQKEAFNNILEQEFGTVTLNQGFDWLVVPQVECWDKVLARICEGLTRHRGFQAFFTPGVALRCDFYVPGHRLIVEYDERQHFSEPRAVCLEQYPVDLPLGFDREKWLAACRSIRARDNDPPYRDEQRAFYDALRDILAFRSGFTVIRIKHGDWDWNHTGSSEHLRELISKSIGNVTSRQNGVTSGK